jgi:hypothetical protein
LMHIVYNLKLYIKDLKGTFSGSLEWPLYIGLTVVMSIFT